MAFLFARSKQKAPLELVRSTKELLQKLATVDKLPSAVSTVLFASQIGSDVFIDCHLVGRIAGAETGADETHSTRHTRCVKLDISYNCLVANDDGSRD
jgi:hypothetical protein